MTLETAPTEFVEAAGTRFAYRRLGPRRGTPLVCLQHFSGTMDSWDPAVVNALVEDRPVIVFDNTGLGRSSGTTPDNVAQMAAMPVIALRRRLSSLWSPHEEWRGRRASLGVNPTVRRNDQSGRRQR